MNLRLTPLLLLMLLPLPSCRAHSLDVRGLGSRAVKVTTESKEGSGTVVGHRGGKTLVLTAGHICAGAEGLEVAEPDGKAHPATAARVSAEPDLCLLEAQGTFGAAAEVSEREPSEGEEVAAPGAPEGIWLGRPFVGDGRYLGWVELEGRRYYLCSVPSRPGSSGSGLFAGGKVVGVLVKGSRAFEHVTLFATLGQVRSFLAAGGR